MALLGFGAGGGASGDTIWAGSSSAQTVALGNGVVVFPFAAGEDTDFEFQFVAGKDNPSMVMRYRMSSSSGNDIVLSCDRLAISDGDDPSGAVTGGINRTITPGTGTTRKTIDSGDIAEFTFSAAEGDVVKGTITRTGTSGSDTHPGDLQVIELAVK